MGGMFLRLMMGVSALALAGSASAQTVAAKEPNKVEELIVTAQKRSEALRDVPINITYVGSDQLQRQNITGLGELSTAAPSVQGGGIGNSLAIRGIGTVGFARSAESAVGVVLDGVPLGRTQSDALFDVDHVEVLNGPQGTLFGKNATAGVINIITKAPQMGVYQAIGHADLGTHEYSSVRLTGNLPLGDTAALRVGLFRDAYGHLIYNPIQNQWDKVVATGARARLRWEPTSNLSVNLIGDYAVNNSNGILSQGVAFRQASTFRYIETVAGTPAGNASNLALLNLIKARCGVTPSSSNTISCADAAGGDDGGYRVTTWGVSGQVDYQLGDFTLTSITAYRGSQFGDFNLHVDQNDVDIRPTNFLNRSLTPTKVKTFSEEIRIASPTDRPLQYVAGAYYSRTHSEDNLDQGGGLGALPPPLILRRVGSTRISAWNIAAFGQLTYKVTDELRLIAGGRLTHDSLRDFSSNSRPACDPPICIYIPGFELIPVDEELKHDNFSWRLGAEYDWTPDVMVYATASRGYKAGFVNEALSTGSPAPVVVKPEIPLAFEVGLKGGFLDGRLSANAALFHTRIKDFQTDVSIPATGAGTVPSYGQGNAPHIITQGVDLTLIARPVEGLSVTGNALYNDAHYSGGYSVACATDYVIDPIPGCIAFVPGGTTGSKVVSGQISGVPKWRFTLSGEYEHTIFDGFTGFVQTDVVYRSGISTLAGDPLFEQGSDAQVGGRIGFRPDGGQWSIAVFGRNLQRDHKFQVGRDFAAPGTVTTNLINFRSFRVVGVTLDARF